MDLQTPPLERTLISYVKILLEVAKRLLYDSKNLCVLIHINKQICKLSNTEFLRFPPYLFVNYLNKKDDM